MERRANATDIFRGTPMRVHLPLSRGAVQLRRIAWPTSFDATAEGIEDFREGLHALGTAIQAEEGHGRESMKLPPLSALQRGKFCPQAATRHFARS